MSLSPEMLALIIDEEDRLAQVIQSLSSQRELAKRRLRTESERAQDMTSQLVAARREADKQMLASDEAVSHGLRDRKREEITEIDTLLKRPYFARLVLLESEGSEERQIDVRLGTVGNPDCRIIDWRRAPISKLYYEYTEGDYYDEEIQGRERSGKILLRHKLDIEEGELVGLTCGLGHFARVDGEWKEAHHRAGRAKVRRLGELPDVLSLITPEQFRAITEDAESAVVIQGIAGSGKTTVALHRLSWLITSGNSDLKRTDALILVRSRPLRAYIEQSLSSLDLEGIRCLTLETWVKQLLDHLPWLGPNRPLFSEKALPPSTERLLRSSALLRTLDFYIDEQRERLIQHLGSLFGNIPACALVLHKARSLSSPSMKIIEQLLDCFGTLPLNALPAGLLDDLNKCRRRLSLFREDLEKILERPGLVLDRDDSHLLDVALIQEARADIAEERATGRIGFSEGVLGLLIAARKGITLARPSGERRKYRHIVIDEVQDFSASDLSLILSQAEQMSQLTLSGDVAQAISGSGSFPGWDALRKYQNLGASSRFIELTVSYRSTAPIMRLADDVLGEQRSQGGRPGKAPLWFSCPDEHHGVRQVLDWLIRLNERYPDSLAAVLCEDQVTARYAFSLLEPTFASAVQLWDTSSQGFQEGILVMSVQEAKGLEFQNVLLWNPHERAYPRTQLGAMRLYVAMTRAEERLCLVTWEKPSPLLPSLQSRLVRGIAVEREDKEAGEAPLLDPLPRGR